MSLVPEKTAAYLDHGSIRLLLYMIEFKLVFVDATVSCFHRQWFVEVFVSNFHDRIISVFNAVPPGGSKGHRHPILIFGLVLCAQTIVCIVDDEIFKLFTILLWLTLFRFLFSTICRQCSADCRTSLTSEKLCIFMQFPSILSHVTNLLPINRIHCKNAPPAVSFPLIFVVPHPSVLETWYFYQI